MRTTHRDRLHWAVTLTVALVGLWWLLGGGEGLLYGFIFAPLAAGLCAWIAPGRLPGLRPLALLRFATLFATRSLAGGLDVAWRAVQPEMPLQPSWVRYPLRLQQPVARSVMMITISLTPGTLCARLENDTLLIHILSPDMKDGIFDIEQAVAAVFGDHGAGRHP